MIAKPVIVLVCGWESDGRIWEPLADRLAERYEVRRWDLRDGGEAPAGAELAVSACGGEDAAVELVREGRAGRAVLLLPEALERGSEPAAVGFPLDIMDEFIPMMSSGDFPDVERRRMVALMTAHLEPVLPAGALELVREVQLTSVAAGLERGAALRDGTEQGRPERASWLSADARVGELLTVLIRATTRLLPRIPGVRVVELAARSDYPWLEDPDEVLAALG
jgi:pimeloyl-ACP methyl ester carboxylesterase